MDIDCPNPCVQCETGISVENFSSEAPDVDLFLARSYGGYQGATVFSDLRAGTGDEPVAGDPDPPPIGSGGENAIVATCESDTSQDDASTCAVNAWNEVNIRNNWPIPKSNPKSPFSSTAQTCDEKCTPNNGAALRSGSIRANTQALADQMAKYYACQRTLCYNQFQSCTVLCPDGSPFTFSVVSGKFLNLNQATANAVARQYACLMALRNRVCMSSLSRTEGCVGQNFVSLLSAGSVNPVAFTVSDGTLPDGLVLVKGPGNNAAIGGVPTVVGQFTFTITAQNTFGLMSKQYTIDINEITQGQQLPNATSGTAYSTALTVGGPVTGNLLWVVQSGNIPIGMTLDQDTGIISGTATDVVDFTYEFTIAVSDGH